MNASHRNKAAVATLLLLTTLPIRAWELVLCANPDAKPYSSQSGKGFDLDIADIVAKGLGAQLFINWMPDRHSSTLLRHLHAGDCDMTMSVIDGRAGTLNSHAYYRTGYVFVRRAGTAEVSSLDDSALRTLRIGVPGGANRPTPPAMGLSRRGLLGGLRHFEAASAAETVTMMGEALAEGSIDVAILWGPMISALDVHGVSAGNGFVVTPLQPEIDIPFMPMVAAFTIGVRPHDEALRDAIDIALAERWDEVQHTLQTAGIPTLSLPRPVMTAIGESER